MKTFHCNLLIANQLFSYKNECCLDYLPSELLKPRRHVFDSARHRLQSVTVVSRSPARYPNWTPREKNSIGIRSINLVLVLKVERKSKTQDKNWNQSENRRGGDSSKCLTCPLFEVCGASGSSLYIMTSVHRRTTLGIFKRRREGAEGTRVDGRAF